MKGPILGPFLNRNKQNEFTILSNGAPVTLISGSMNANINGSDLGNTTNATLIINPFTPTVIYNYQVSKQFDILVEKWKLKWVVKYD